MVNTFIERILESKTYVLLIVVALIALATCFIAAIFGEALWAKYLDFLSIQSGLGGARAIANDGVPKVVEAMKAPAPVTISPYNPVSLPTPDQFSPLD